LCVAVALWLCNAGPWTWTPLSVCAGEQSRARSKDASSSPNAEVPAPSHDLGVIKSKGMTYQHDFLVLNVGNGVLEIKEVVVG
jgi:hypothetical protein